MVKAKPIIKKNARTGGLVFKLLVLAGFFVLFFVGYKLFQETYRQNQINVEILQLQKEIEKLNQDNQNLNELISYLQTDDFKEKEAKDKLNLIKEGEKLVLIKEKNSQANQGNSQNKNEEEKTEIVINKPNYYWWWHYFFSM